MRISIVIFGTGKYGKEAYNYFGSENVLCFIDNNKELSGTDMFNKSILLPEQLKKIKENYVVLLAVREELCIEMEYQLLEMGIERFLYFDFVRDYMLSEGISSCEFVQLCGEDVNVYKLMYEQELLKEKKCQEKLEFFISYSDIRHLKPMTGKLRQRQIECVNLLKKLDKMTEEIDINIILEGGNLLGAIRSKCYIPWDDDMDVVIMRKEYNRLIHHLKDNNLLLIPDSDCTDYCNIDYQIKDAIKNNKENMIFCLNGIFLVGYCIGMSGNLINIDIFPMDYYKEDCKYDDIIRFIIPEEKKIAEKKRIKERVIFNEELVQCNPLTSIESTSKIGYGIEVFFCLKSCSEFYNREDVFPLIKRQYENNEFKTPYNSENYLRTLYGDIYQWPADAGAGSHGMNRHYITYRRNGNYIYIDSLEKMKNVICDENFKDTGIIVEKYKIHNNSEYFKIIEVLENADKMYYVYA